LRLLRYVNDVKKKVLNNITFTRSFNITLILILLILTGNCKKDFPSDHIHYTYIKPEQVNDGWKVSALSEVGMDVSIIERITENILNDQYRGIHSMLIVKDGVLVYEEYFNNHNRDDLQTIYSITKSITSSLTGLAIQEGFIAGVEESVLQYFPQYNIPDNEKQKLQIKHILTLTTGIVWDEKTYPYTDPRNSEYQMVQSDDWMEFVLQQPLLFNPGETFNYNTGAVHLLSAVIKQSTTLFADDFAGQYLFEPLGISEFEWNTDNLGYPCTGATFQGLKMKARDVAKYGFLHLNKGKWNGNQVIPEAWVEESTQEHVDVTDDRGFGYLWWTGSYTMNEKEIPHFYAAGFGGQTIHIVPELDLMIVFTCWDNAQDADIFLPIIMIYSAIQ
jgi:CubicO group peptidase (beta-lactamase class C family)